MIAPGRRLRMGIGAAIVVALAISAAVVQFGVRRPPSYPDLTRNPDPSLTGTLAYSRPCVTKNGPLCVAVRAAGGGPEQELLVNSVQVIGLSFPDATSLEVDTYGGSSPASPAPTYVRTVYDLVTGEPRSSKVDPSLRPSAPSAEARRADGTVVRIMQPRHVELIEPDGRGRTLFEPEGVPDGYGLSNVSFSPDGRWVVIDEWTGRSLVVNADGSPHPRVLVAGRTIFGGPSFGSRIAWWQPSS